MKPVPVDKFVKRLRISSIDAPFHTLSPGLSPPCSQSDGPNGERLVTFWRLVARHYARAGKLWPSSPLAKVQSTDALTLGMVSAYRSEQFRFLFKRECRRDRAAAFAEARASCLSLVAPGQKS